MFPIYIYPSSRLNECFSRGEQVNSIVFIRRYSPKSALNHSEHTVFKSAPFDLEKIPKINSSYILSATTF